MPTNGATGTVCNVYRRLLVLVCFAGLTLGIAYVGTGMLENALRATTSGTVNSRPDATRAPAPSDTSAPGAPVTATVPGNPALPSSSGSLAPGGFEPGFDPAVAEDVVTRLNAERLSAGLAPLRFDAALAAEAAAWSEQMTRNGYVHSTQDRLLALSTSLGVGGMAENLHAPEVQCAAAISCDVPEAHPTSGVLHVDWMRSGAHRSTMLSPAWDRVGVGVYCDSAGRMWATALFAAPVGVPVRGDATVPAREPVVPGNDGITCGGFERAHNARWNHTKVS